MKSVTYSGHTASDEGVSTWPSRRLTRRWEHLAKIETAVSFDAKTYHVKILFAVGKTLTLRGTKFAPSSMRRFAEFLGLAIARAPAGAEIDGRTREIAQWGGVETEGCVRRMKGMAPSMAQWIEQARFLRARLEHGKALKAVARVLERQPSHAEALELRFQLLEETGTRLPKLIAAAEQVALHAPDEAAARTRVLGLKLQANDARIVPEVERVLAREPDNFVLGFALAGYFFRAKEFERAMAVTDALAKRPGATAWQRGAAESRDYVQRYATSGTFRAKERLKRWSIVAAALAPILLVVAVKAWSALGQREHRRQMEEVRQGSDERMAKLREEAERRAREFQDLTGRAVGSYAELKPRADAGEAAAQLAVADYLFEGRQGAVQDATEAKRYLEMAAAKNHRAAALELGERFRDGRGMEIDHVQAIAWLEKASTLDSPRASALLGNYHSEGKHVPKDERKAFGFFQKAAAGGNTWGETQMGWALERGRGVEKDLAAAVASYRRAAENRDRWAQERLVRLHADRRLPVYDEKEAVRWTEIGARQGSAALRVRYAAATMAGAAQNAAEVAQAKVWLREAAEKGDPAALHLAGEIEWLGWYQPPNLAEAARLFELAADKNYPRAMVNHAYSLAAGVGVTKDLDKARALRDKLVGMGTPSHVVERLDRVIEAMARPLPDIPAGGEMKPRAIIQENPTYPASMVHENLSGEVVIEFKIGKDGHTRDIKVVRSSHAAFEGPGVTAVAFWRFEPAIKGGRRVVLRVTQLLEFRLENQEAESAGAELPEPETEK